MAGHLVDDTDVVDGQLTDEALSDEALSELALAADPETVVADGAVSLWDLARGDGADLLPEWYMPAPAAGARAFRGWRRWLILLMVVVFVALEAYGLCSAYGSVVLG